MAGPCNGMPMMTAANRSAYAACALKASRNKGASRPSLFGSPAHGGRKTRRNRRRSTRRNRRSTRRN